LNHKGCGQAIDARPAFDGLDGATALSSPDAGCKYIVQRRTDLIALHKFYRQAAQ
jgi:hypothetical protein